MRRRSWQVLGALGLALGIPSTAHAISATSFVPNGYYVEHQVSVDIDADGRTDHVYVVRRREAPLLNTTRDRRVLVIRALPNHSNLLIAEGRRAALCTGCGGAIWEGRAAQVTLTHAEHTFTIGQSFGTTRIKAQKLTFGFVDGQVRMIRVAQTVDNHLIDRVTRTATDLVTGAVHVTYSIAGEPNVNTFGYGTYRTVPLHVVDFTGPLLAAESDPTIQ